MIKCITIVFILCAGQVVQAETNDLLSEAFDKAADDAGVPVKLLRAVCWAESKHDPRAYNHGDGKGTNHAFGICQVLHATAKDFGFKDSNCYKSFEDKVAIKSSRTYKDCKLFGVYTSAYYGALWLKAKLSQYNGSWSKAIPAYNSGTVKICRTGKVLRVKDKSVIGTCIPGQLLNQGYLDDVVKALEEQR